ncbi:MAG: AraC family transcriptional regulator [Clostridia bacterium]|nr:AraC family transcriptional regulator [Clostridia bacterium]
MKDNVLYDKSSAELLALQNHYLDDTYKAAPHTHSRLEISCVKAGFGQYYVDGKWYDVRPYDVFLFNNIEPHCLKVDKGQQLLNMVIHFEPEFIWNNLSRGIDYGFLKVFFDRNNNFENRLDRNNPATKRIYDLMIGIEQEFLNCTEAYDLMIKIKLQSIFVEMIRNFDCVTKTTEENAVVLKDTDAMRKVFVYIKDHLADDIKLDDLANIALMSPSHFSTSFKAFNGVTPIEYIVKSRVARSIEYIRSTNKSMTEIATLCGFNNSTNFIKSFKKVTGKTPSYYRSGEKK